MNTGSLELCKELAELSNWGETDYMWASQGASNPGLWHISKLELVSVVHAPAYTLGYLLGRLPGTVDFHNVPHQIRLEWRELQKDWWASYSHINDVQTYDESPENCLCKLAIELFKQGVLKK